MLDLIYDRTADDLNGAVWMPAWQQGTIGTVNGANGNSTTRCRTADFKNFASEGLYLSIYVPDGFKMSGRKYAGTTAGTIEQSFPSGAWIRGSYTLEALPDKYYRFVLAREDDTAFAPSAAAESGVSFTVFSAKGSYNFTDLNRVEAAVRALADALNSAGWNLAIVTKTDWHEATDAADEQDMPYASDMARYIGNVAAIRRALAFYRTTPPVPDSMDLITWQKANAIEKILADAEMLINNMLAARHYSGEPFSGEV